MGRVKRFEDLVAWQKARTLTGEIYRNTNTSPFSKDYGLVDQMRRAAASVMSNIAEGYERNNVNEYRRYCLIAKGSCGELRAQLYVAYDVGYLPDDIFQALMSQAIEVSRILSGLIASINRKTL